MIESYITSAIDGRLRIRHPFIMDKNLAAAILEFLQGQPLLENVNVNDATGSVLIEYDVNKTTQAEIISNLEEYAMSYCMENGYLEELLKFEEKANAERTHVEDNCDDNLFTMPNLSSAKSRKVIHRTMLTFLALSTGFALLDRTSGHVLFAGLFVSGLMTHLYINRKRM